MASIADIARWITENESLLSGIAAIVAVSGVALSTLGIGTRRWLARNRSTRPPITPAESSPASTQARSMDRTPPPPDATGSAATSEPILAVLAFENLSSDPEMRFFSDGVSEEIIQRLSRGANLKVIGRLSSFQFRGERKAEAAQSLRCSHVLDGSIRRAEGRVRVSAHLIEAKSKTTLWSDRYDRGLDDIFAVQDEISENIARALDQRFSSFSTPSIDPAVFDLYLRASPRSYAPD